MNRTEALAEITRLEHSLHELANFTLSDAYKYNKEELARLRLVVGQYGCHAAHLPGSPTTIWYDTRREAVASAKDANRQPWNRNSNRALIIAPDGTGTRLYA
jgi:hypothetical protein